MADKPNVKFPESRYVLRGPCAWPKLFKPNTRFNTKGVFEIDVLYPDDSPQLEAVQAEILRILKETRELVESDPSFEKAITRVTPGKKGQPATKDVFIKEADMPWKASLTKDGEPTGYTKIKAKATAAYTNKEGETVPITISVFDKSGVPWNPKVNIGGGSVVQVSVVIRGFFVPALGLGVSIHLRAVKVDQHKASYDPNDPTTFGFTMDDVEEAGFEPDAPVSDAQKSESGDY